IVGAAQNGADVVGVAPGVWLMSVKVLDSSGSGYDSNVIAGLNYIANYIAANLTNGDVVNMSLGRPYSAGDDGGPLHQAVQALTDPSFESGRDPITVVVAAGNDPSKEISDMVPARFSEVMAVASTTAEDGNNKCRSYSGRIWADTASYFTTDGTGVAISAPGAQKENISRGCRAQSVGILSLALGGGTTRKSGTSMASPHVAGVVALMLQATPGLAPNTVRSIIQGTADKCGTAPLNSPTNGYSFDGVREGIVDAYAAVNDLACPPPAS
ncbi:MAG: S8 family serine peptidase, partial [Proteobacteria bacterium]|nr:S8 family serine peptidase [Pseudomonadota bacterium]